MTKRVGLQLGNYILTRLIGSGGFAEVYLGEHIYLHTQAAIKILHTYLNNDVQQNFLEEARTIAHISHPNIVRMLEFGSMGDNTPYFIMEYAPNGSLRDRYPKGTSIPLMDIVLYVKQVASALQHAHNKKIIHRDVKPENILLSSEDKVLLSDFGIAITAHSTHSQTLQDVIGTMAYMAPEQLLGNPRPASDQYALGIVVYEWLCGNRPFDGTASEILAKHIQVPPKPLQEWLPELPQRIESVVLKALAKEPEARYNSVGAFANDLEAAYLANDQTYLTISLNDSSSLPLVLKSLEEVSPSSPTKPSFHSNSTSYSELTEVEKSDVFSPFSNFPPMPPAPPGPLVAEASENRCPHCGSIMLFNAPFCPNCGRQSLIGTSLSQGQESLLASVLRPSIEKVNPSTFLGSEPTISDLPTILPLSDGKLPETPNSTVTLAILKEQWMTKGNAHYKAGAYKNALASFEEALALDPTDAAIYAHKGNALRKRRRNKDALDAYNKAIEFDPDNASYWHFKGELLYRLGKYPDAREACEYALVLATTEVTFWITYAKVLFSLKLYIEALNAYDRTMKFTSKKWQVWVKRGEILYELNKYQESLEAYNYAHLLNPGDNSIYQYCNMLRDLISQHHEKTPELLHTDPPDKSFDSEQVISSNKPDKPGTSLGPSINFPIRASSSKKIKTTENNNAAQSFDVFLSYLQPDLDWVTKLASNLEDKEGFHVWLDKWLSVPGKSWIQEKADGINQSRCVAVCIGKQTPHGWFQQEIERAQNKQASDPDFRVIPVYLPGANSDIINTSDFLNLKIWVDFRDSDQGHAFHLLVCGIKGIPPGRWPPKDITIASTTSLSTETEDRLRDLKHFKESELIDERVATEFQRMVLEKVWLRPQSAKENPE